MRDIVRSKKERELVRVKIHDGNAFWNEIGVNDGVSKLMLLSLNLLLPVLVYVARNSLTVVRHKLMLPDVLDLEEAKTAQAKEIASLKKRVKQLEKIRKSRTSGLKRRCIQTGRKIADSCADAESDLIDEANERNDGKRCCFDVQRCFKVKKKVVDEKGKFARTS
ncbi:hypothetical protein Tco_0442860 [Tanacetum coccineum]